MAVTRADLVTYLAEEFDAAMDQVGVTATDDGPGLGRAVDATLLALETAYGDLATATLDEADGAKARALARYHALVRLCDAAAASFNVALPGGLRADLKGVFDNLNALRADAAATLKALGLSPGGAALWRRVRIGLDKLEPAPVAVR